MNMDSTSATLDGMGTVGLRELRQQASELVRRVEAGEEITVTVAGRASARLVPARSTHWRAWADLSELFDGPGDPDWERDRDEVDGVLEDPWTRQ